MPHELTQDNCLDRIFICKTLHERKEIEPFLKRLTTDEKQWITKRDNVQIEKYALESVAKPRLRP